NDRGHVGIGGAQSATSNVDIVVSPVNDAPLVTGTPGGITFTENDAPATIDSGITIVDVDDTHLESATASIGGFIPGEEALLFADQNGITGTWDPTHGVLTLIGHATLADYQTALGSIQYVNSSENPTGGNRTIFFVVNDGSDASAAVSRTVTVVPVNDQPTATTLSRKLQE